VFALIFLCPSRPPAHPVGSQIQPDIARLLHSVSEFFLLWTRLWLACAFLFFFLSAYWAYMEQDPQESVLSPPPLRLMNDLRFPPRWTRSFRFAVTFFFKHLTAKFSSYFPPFGSSTLRLMIHGKSFFFSSFSSSNGNPLVTVLPVWFCAVEETLWAG